MNELFAQTGAFAVVLSLAAFWVGTRIHRKLPMPLTNPLLIAMVLVIAALLLLDVDYETYDSGMAPLSFLLTPATVCLAVPLYRQLLLLRKHLGAILISVAAGCVACAATILLLAKLMAVSPEVYHSLQPKSVTTAIALGISERMGGLAGITTLAITITGLTGVILSDTVFRLLHIMDPVARGLALGNSCHALGTSHALELGEVEGAMSSLTIVVAGVMTVILAPLASPLL